jgi:hypothetical protein
VHGERQRAAVLQSKLEQQRELCLQLQKASITPAPAAAAAADASPSAVHSLPSTPAATPRRVERAHGRTGHARTPRLSNAERMAAAYDIASGRRLPSDFAESDTSESEYEMVGDESDHSATPPAVSPAAGAESAMGFAITAQQAATVQMRLATRFASAVSQSGYVLWPSPPLGLTCT